MKEFLNSYERKYLLNLGDYRFSPVMKASIGLSLSYRELHFKNQQSLPLFLSFPEKNLASVWLSISLLTNFFLEDYINQTGIEQIDSFSRGDKIEIFGTVAKIETVSPEIITLEFSDQGGIPINKRLRSQISKTNKSLVNKKSLFIKNYKASKTKRNPISKILEPNDPISINQKYLLSKVLLITGRGNVRKLSDILRTSEIYGEPLNKIFLEEQNLLIEKDLESFNSAFAVTSSDKDRLFKELFIEFLETDINIDTTKKEYFLNQLGSDNFLTTKFKEELDYLLEILNESSPRFINLYKLYPGIRERVSTNIKAVVINDIEQIEIYKSAVTGFLQNGVPVFVITDRHISSYEDLGFHDTLFKKYPQAHRINWNRSKIKSLQNQSEIPLDYLDISLWESCCRYASQKINIKLSKSFELDKLLSESQNLIKGLDEYEIIQKSYYKYLFPAIYLFKNSNNKCSQINKLTDLFDIELQNIKLYLEQHIYNLLQQIVDFLKSGASNVKDFSLFENIFSNILSVENGHDIFIPSGTSRLNISDNKTQKIVFTGYPFNEFSGKYLLDAVCKKFVPDISILCWPLEGELTYNYLKRRILAGYFTDYTDPEWNIPNELLLKNSDDFIEELNSYFFCERAMSSNPSINSIDHEQDILAITNIKYKGYNNLKDNNSYSVKCDILNFNDGSFLFLPKNSRVLALIETQSGSPKFKNALFSELEIGCKVFNYKKDRYQFRELSKNNSSVRKALIEIEIWRDTLNELFIKFNNNLDELSSFLTQIKVDNSLAGNPSRNNIQRWLYDDELIAPDSDNLIIILNAAKIRDAYIVASNIENSRRIVNGHSISLSSEIKNKIIKSLERKADNLLNDFELAINSIQITVGNRIITGLEPCQIEIEYHNTRKILM